jgi:RNA polymerase subunit RPABC4/transcription elongation factor Spt4
MGKTGRQVVGIFAGFFGVVNIVIAGLYSYYFYMIDSTIGPFIRVFPNEVRNIIYTLVGGNYLTLIGFVLVGIFWFIIAYGLLNDMDWAVILAKILAILYLIGSIFTCNCIGLILSIIVLYLLKSEKDDLVKDKGKKEDSKKSKDSDRRCPNCGRVIPFDAVLCPYCGNKFRTFFHHEPKAEKKKDDSIPLITPLPSDKDKGKDSKDKIKNIKDDKKKKKTGKKTDVKSCHVCGASIKKTAKFCTKCGTKFLD